MHALSLCGYVYEIVDRAASGRSVAVIHLQVGQLRQVVPDTLRYCWTVVCDQTELAGPGRRHHVQREDAVRVQHHAVRSRATTVLVEDPGKDDYAIRPGPVAGLANLADTTRVGIIEGDIETSIDADRLAGFGAQVALLNTSNGFGGECHLDAPMVASALARLDLARMDLLFIENVGNLVCPAEFDVGAHHRVMVYSITEGEEKPLNYPRDVSLRRTVLVNKLDLLPHLDFDLALFRRNLAAVNPAVTVLNVSARTAEELDAWYDWLRERGRLAGFGADPVDRNHTL